MKVRHSIPLLASLLLAGAGSASAGKFRDRQNSEELRQRRSQLQLPTSFKTVSTADSRVKSPTTADLFTQSTILTAGPYWTLVPKGSVLHIPVKQDHHLVEKPSGTMIPWRDFLFRNRSWLGTEEVSIETASGKRPMLESIANGITRRDRIVVAVHQGGAISVNQPSPPQS